MARTSLRFDRDEFESKVSDFLDSIQIRPKTKKENYILSFIHRSVLNEASMGYIESNERLEYLGDAVLELVITEALFYRFPEKTEGELTDIRSALVRGRNLAEIANKLRLSEVMQVSRGEYQAHGHENPYILANAFEAFVGALYTDQGIEMAKSFILEQVFSTLDHILQKGLYVDPKSYLQELTQEVWGGIPEYMVLEEIGADHNKKYRVAVCFGDCELGQGMGTSKKKGEQDAAENALSRRTVWEGEVPLKKKSVS